MFTWRKSTATKERYHYFNSVRECTYSTPEYKHDTRAVSSTKLEMTGLAVSQLNSHDDGVNDDANGVNGVKRDACTAGRHGPGPEPTVVSSREDRCRILEDGIVNLAGNYQVPGT